MLRYLQLQRPCPLYLNIIAKHVFRLYTILSNLFKLLAQCYKEAKITYPLTTYLSNIGEGHIGIRGSIQS